MNTIAEQHADLAQRFADLAAGVHDWSAPTPVPEWTAKDVVTHLATWLPAMLEGYGVALPTVDTERDPLIVWEEHTANVQRLLDDDAQLERVVQTPMGDKTVADVVESFYLSDVFMHQYDLAKASGQPVGWQEEVVTSVVESMAPQADFLRQSGQFGDPVVLDDSHSPEARLAALIGRDPNWHP